MPRTFQATVALICTLAAIGLVSLFHAWQTHSTEQRVLELKDEIKKLALAQQQIKDQLKRGVAVSSTAGNGGANSGTGGHGQTDPYASSLADPQNILKAATDLKVPADAKYTGTLRKIMGDDPKGFNWLLENSVDVANLQDLVHETFARRDFKAPDNFVPGLAHKITISEDYKVYTIHLRKGVKWHVPPVPNIAEEKYAWLREPREVTAEDAKFFFDLVKNPQVEAGSKRNYYEDVEKVEILDTHTFRVTWKKKTHQSLSSTLEAYPMPKWLFTKNDDGTDIPEATLGLKFNNHWASPYPIGTGPYKFIKYTKGVSLDLERNEEYWGQRPPIQKIDSKILKDPEQHLLNLKSNQVDYAGLTATQYKTEVLNDKGSAFNTGKLEHQTFDMFGYSYIGWNADKPLFADKRVRQAMTHAFNRQDIIQNVYHGLGAIQTGPFFYKHTANNPAVQPYPFDLKKAAALLDEAGWKDTNGDNIRDKIVNGTPMKLSFTVLSYANAKEWDVALSVFKEDLRKIGVEMNFSPVDWPTMQKKMNEKAFDAFTGGWGLDWGIDPFQLWHSSQADIPKGSNRVGFRNKRADAIIEELRQSFDEKRRLELCYEFHSILHDEQPYTFFRAPKAVIAWNPRVKNFQVQTIRPQTTSLPWYIDGPPSK